MNDSPIERYLKAHPKAETEELLAVIATKDSVINELRKVIEQQYRKTKQLEKGLSRIQRQRDEARSELQAKRSYIYYMENRLNQMHELLGAYKVHLAKRRFRKGAHL